MSPWGLRFEYPLRDWSKVELQQYSQVCPELADIVVPDVPPSDNVLTKNLSIDELMMRYVLTQGEKYPGVMANVSRTANKLQATSFGDTPPCALCGNIIGNVKGNTGLTVSSQSGEEQDAQFCYGCMRSRPNLIS
jgi:cytoplasmic tRNA 2-thiolation protein 2